MKRRYTYTIDITQDVSYNAGTWLQAKLFTLSNFEGDELDMIMGIL